MLLWPLALTLNRLDSYHKEFKLLYYGLSSARIFFRPTEEIDDGGEDEDDNKKKNDQEDGADIEEN